MIGPVYYRDLVGSEENFRQLRDLKEAKKEERDQYGITSKWARDGWDCDVGVSYAGTIGTKDTDKQQFAIPRVSPASRAQEVGFVLCKVEFASLDERSNSSGKSAHQMDDSTGSKINHISNMLNLAKAQITMTGIYVIVMFLKLVCFTIVFGLSVNDDSVEYDPVIYYLLNGEFEDPMPSESVESEETSLNGGLWKCGMCEDIGEFQLMYRETNKGDDTGDPSLQTKIEVTLQGMKCVIVRSSSANIVKSIMGDCEGPSVTLTLTPTELFTLDVYGGDTKPNGTD
ncbi:hypothetical protein evm_003502 [Chilo suppressalis]|nr:hypothetical protein evm_003502 [Chilo suppressalis]